MIYLIYVQITTRFERELCKTLLLTELSTPFLAIRWMLVKAKMIPTRLYVVNGISLWISFVVFRMYPTPHFVYTAYQLNEKYHNLPSRSMLYGFVIVTCMNVYWFSLITIGIVKAALRAVKGTKENKKE